MLIKFETKSSEVLEKYLREFVNPELMSISFRNILTMWIYGLYFERKVYRIGDIVVISQKGYIEKMMGYALLFLVAGAFSCVFLKLNNVLFIDMFLMVPCMILMSTKYATLAKIWKIKLLGHKNDVGFVSDSYLIRKLLLGHEGV